MAITRIRIVFAWLILLLSMSVQAAEDLSQLHDRIAIQELLSQYAYRWDSKRSDAFADLFTPDALIERWRDGELIESSVLEGRAAIQTYARNSHRGRLADRQTRHHFSNVVFLELSAENAVTENMALITHQTAQDNVARISSSGIYRISWRKSQGRWRMAKRVLFSDSFTPN